MSRSKNLRRITLFEPAHIAMHAAAVIDVAPNVYLSADVSEVIIVNKATTQSPNPTLHQLSGPNAIKSLPSSC